VRREGHQLGRVGAGAGAVGIAGAPTVFDAQIAALAPTQLIEPA
jgi:hypothetical protein